MDLVKLLCVGDVVGTTGRTMFQKHIGRLREQYALDGIIVNGENSAHGKGITSRIVHFFKHNGVDVITSGNHVWYHKEVYNYMRENTDLLRPANYPSGVPGVGATTFTTAAGVKVGVINLQGRVFMRDNLDCPFKTADSILTYLKSKASIIIVDFHAEATSEKQALGYFLDGRVSAVVGTHTHIQTADERILPGGTAYITDLGMVGSLNSMLGMKKEPIIEHFLTQMPTKFKVDFSQPLVLWGAVITCDAWSGKAVAIERVAIIDDTLKVEDDEKD
jgi:metallophosphoesterase (TIGR00282 family)